ncbi:hypothetical protein LXL04_009095 [Taraxacum kok-saghyz]
MKSVDAIINGSISVSSSDPYPFSSSATRAQRTWELAPVAPSMAMLSFSGSSLDGFYRILSKMGEGTFGQVLECLDNEKKDPVAIKIVQT